MPGIGMSSGLWNPRAKGPLQIQNNSPAMPMSNPTPMAQDMNPMMNPMMRQPGGMQPNYPPIAASRNLLTRHMALPNSKTQSAGVNAPMNNINNNQRPRGAMRRIF